MSVYLGPGGRRGRRADSFTLCPFDLDGTAAALIGLDQKFLTEQLAAAGIAAVPVASGPGHGRHVWTRCRQEIPARLVKRIADALTGANGRRPLCPTLDPGPLLNPATGCLRAPGSPHRGGDHSRLLEHTPDEAIAVLAEGAPLAAYQQLAERLEYLAARQRRCSPPGSTAGDGHARKAGAGTIRRLPPSLTRHGEPVRSIARDDSGRLRLDAPLRTPGEATRVALLTRLDPDQDHSAHVFRILKGLALAGFTHAAVAQLAADADRSPGLEGLRTARPYRGAPLRVARPSWEVAGLLARQWDLAVEAAARVPKGGAADHDPAPQVTTAVLDLLHRIDTAGVTRWARQSGPADRATLLAIAVVMLTSGQAQVSVDVRRAAVMTGYSRQTANQAIHRLMADGWIREIAPADRRRSQARIVGLAASHTCTAHHRHSCAVRTPADQHEHGGSDTRANARPPEGGRAIPGSWLYDVRGSELSDRAEIKHRLVVTLSEIRADLWGLLGHHAAWTYQAVGEVSPTARDLAQTTGYSMMTIAKHLAGFVRFGLVVETENGWKRTERDVSDVARELPAEHRTRSIDRAVVYVLERAVHRWWSAEVAWMRLSRAEKRARGRRASADQIVLPGVAATARAYPRRNDGTPDHIQALTIEAGRLGTADLAAAALHQLDTGIMVDPLELLATERLDVDSRTSVAAARAA